MTDIEPELAKLRRELAKVKMERDILIKNRGVLREGVDMRYATIKELRLHYPVTELCHQLGISESGYYSWCSRSPSQRKKDDTK